MKKDFTLSHGMAGIISVLHPTESEPPILPPSTRSAIHQWMVEINCADELKEVNITPRTSCLLSGPPGCGKTTLAHHLSARLGLPLVCVNMDRIVSCYMGATANNVASVFEMLSEQHENCVAFFDEFDAIATKRRDYSHGGSAGEERNSIVSALLTRVESFKGIMIAATNRSTALDPAIWRRFGMQLEIPQPGVDERYAILARYSAPYVLDNDTLQCLSESTVNASPSLLRQLMEGMKRDIVLSKRFNHEQTIEATLMRVIAQTRPHEDYEQPPLWKDPRIALSTLSKTQWPPSIKEPWRKKP